MLSYSQDSHTMLLRSQLSSSSDFPPCVGLSPTWQMFSSLIHLSNSPHVTILESSSHGRCMSFIFTKTPMIWPHGHRNQNQAYDASEGPRQKNGRQFLQSLVCRCQNNIGSRSICKGKSRTTRQAQIDWTQNP